MRPWRIISAAGLCLIISALGCDKLRDMENAAVEKEMDNVHAMVVKDVLEQYGIAKRSGDKMQTCVQAGLVAASYLQAKDELNFRKWNAQERSDCAAAGLPTD